MELMDTSFDQCYKHIYGTMMETIPEDILGMTSLAVCFFSSYCVIVRVRLVLKRTVVGD